MAHGLVLASGLAVVLALILRLLAQAPLDPQECVEKCRACICRFDRGVWVCECVTPR